jgi:hypothetical protein
LKLPYCCAKFAAVVFLRRPSRGASGQAPADSSRATKRGAAEKILSLPANVIARLHGIALGLTTDLMGVVNRVLPKGRGVDSRMMRPYAEGNCVLSALTGLGRSAAGEYLQDREEEAQPVTDESTIPC